MIRWLLYFISGFLKCRLIPREEGKPYLERYYLCTIRGKYYYLHRFVDADGDAHLHGHPWLMAWSIILAGGYREARAVIAGVFRSHFPRYGKIIDLLYLPDAEVDRFNRIAGNDFHQITRIFPETWTLFVHTEWCQPWGFAEELRDHKTVANALYDIRRCGLVVEPPKGKDPYWWRRPGVRRGWWSGREKFNTQLEKQHG